MQDILSALEKSGLFHAKGLELLVSPASNTITLAGYISLRKYGKISDEQKRFEGEEAKQIKAALEEAVPKGCAVHVKLQPEALKFKGGAYHFTLACPHKSAESLQKELSVLLAEGAIGEHVFPVSKGWAARISGEGHPH